MPPGSYTTVCGTCCGFTPIVEYWVNLYEARIAAQAWTENSLYHWAQVKNEKGLIIAQYAH